MEIACEVVIFLLSFDICLVDLFFVFLPPDIQDQRPCREVQG
jgi:hypothetical protein